MFLTFSGGVGFTVSVSLKVSQGRFIVKKKKGKKRTAGRLMVYVFNCYCFGCFFFFFELHCFAYTE